MRAGRCSVCFLALADRRDELDPLTLQIVEQTNASGNVVRTTYDENRSPTRVEDRMSGTVTVTRYNRYGKPVEQVGPTKGLLTSPTAPMTFSAHIITLQRAGILPPRVA